jgi:hypothetical protein
MDRIYHNMQITDNTCKFQPEYPEIWEACMEAGGRIAHRDTVTQVVILGLYDEIVKYFQPIIDGLRNGRLQAEGMRDTAEKVVIDNARTIWASSLMYDALKDACELYLSQNGSKPHRGWLLAIAAYEGRYTVEGE